MDLAFEAARAVAPDLVIANDPDADRCAVAVPDPDAEGGWRMLRGDEVGALLAAHLVRRGVTGVFAESIVSSSLLGRIAAAAGVGYEETLTGFKWIARVEGLRYGYEEALGYCVDPEGVRDKDGITAALLVTELASVLKEEGRTLTDLLDVLAVEHGLHATDQLSVRVEDLGIIARAMAAARAPAGLPRRSDGRLGRGPDQGHGGAAAHGRAALPPGGRLQGPGDRASQRHRAQAQVLPGGRGPGLRRGRPAGGPRHGRRAARRDQAGPGGGRGL